MRNRDWLHHKRRALYQIGLFVLERVVRNAGRGDQKAEGAGDSDIGATYYLIGLRPST
ncbi:MAG TPA: hypothetical protein VF182_00160 [Candidatus Binatia bacterium]